MREARPVRREARPVGAETRAERPPGADRLDGMSDHDPAEILRPASQPRYGHEVRWDVRIPVRDGLELSANLWLPLTADTSHAAVVADAAEAAGATAGATDAAVTGNTSHAAGRNASRPSSR